MAIDLIPLVVRTVQELQEADEITLDAALSADTALFGDNGLLDSVSLVAIVVAVEQAIEDEHGASILLADDRAMSQEQSPYRTIGTLVAYAEALLGEATPHG